MQAEKIGEVRFRLVTDPISRDSARSDSPLSQLKVKVNRYLIWPTPGIICGPVCFGVRCMQSAPYVDCRCYFYFLSNRAILSVANVDK